MEVSNIIFSCILIISIGFFAFNMYKIIRNIRLGKAKNRFDNPLKRIKILLKIAFGQTKLFARPASGILHALVYWGFLNTSTSLLIHGLIYWVHLDMNKKVFGH